MCLHGRGCWARARALARTFSCASIPTYFGEYKSDKCGDYLYFAAKCTPLRFAISPGVRPISPGRRARSARSACGPAQRGKMRVLFRESSILVRFFIPFSFALDTMLLPFIRFEARALVPHFATGFSPLDLPISQRPFPHFASA